MKRLALMMCLMLSLSGWSQSDSTRLEKAFVTLRIHPFRFVYGLNVGADVRLGEKTLIGFMVQGQNRDFVSPMSDRSQNEIKPAVGWMADLQLYLEFKNVLFHGPRVAMKEVTFNNVEWVDGETADEFSTTLDQQNIYLTYSLGLRRGFKGFHIMTYATVGGVMIRYSEYDSRTQHFETGERFSPHIIGGLSLGWNF